MGGHAYLKAAGVVLCLLLLATASQAATVEMTQVVSVNADGVEGDATTQAVAISASGRFVAFESLADNLVPGDSNRTFDIFGSEPVCPHCGAAFATTRCLECGSNSPIGAWSPPAEPQTGPGPTPA